MPQDCFSYWYYSTCGDFYEVSMLLKNIFNKTSQSLFGQDQITLQIVLFLLLWCFWRLDLLFDVHYSLNIRLNLIGCCQYCTLRLKPGCMFQWHKTWLGNLGKIVLILNIHSYGRKMFLNEIYIYLILYK